MTQEDRGLLTVVACFVVCCLTLFSIFLVCHLDDIIRTIGDL